MAPQFRSVPLGATALQPLIMRLFQFPDKMFMNSLLGAWRNPSCGNEKRFKQMFSCRYFTEEERMNSSQQLFAWFLEIYAPAMTVQRLSELAVDSAVLRIHSGICFVLVLGSFSEGFSAFALFSQTTHTSQLS